MSFRVFRHGSQAVVGWLICFLPAVVFAAPADSPHASVALISEQTSVQPGSEFQIGLHFKLEKDWHVYWINPGDSGEPPRVEWKLPPQFRAGPLQWPAPQRLENGPLVDFGYENEVLLLATVRAPANLKPRGTVELRGNVKWLVCHDICIPERKTVILSLPVAKDAPKHDSRWRGLFVHTLSQLPKRLPAEWNVTVISKARSFALSVKTGTAEPKAFFFPLEPLQIKNAAPQRATPFENGVRLVLQKSDELLHSVPSLKGILVLNQGRVYGINAPVTQQNRSGE